MGSEVTKIDIVSFILCSQRRILTLGSRATKMLLVPRLLCHFDMSLRCTVWFVWVRCSG